MRLRQESQTRPVAFLFQLVCTRCKRRQEVTDPERIRAAIRDGSLCDTCADEWNERVRAIHAESSREFEELMREFGIAQG